MANIESVKLPNGNEYNIKDAISGYVEPVASPTADNLASLTASGRIADSGIGKSVIPNEIATRNVVGAKNLLKNKGVSGTYGGATFTFNADGSVNINGTYTLTTPGVREYVLMSLSFNDPIEDWMRTYAGKSLIFSKGHDKKIGCIFTVIASDYSPICRIGADVSEDEGRPVVLDITNASCYNCCLFLDETTVFDNVTVYPMIRFATDTDSTYEPYAQTNRELTVNKVNTSAIAPTEDGATASQAYAVGNYFLRGGNFCKCIQAIASGASFTLNTNYSITTVADELYSALH